jgi:hypothetical protein
VFILLELLNIDALITSVVVVVYVIVGVVLETLGDAVLNDVDSYVKENPPTEYVPVFEPSVGSLAKTDL